MLPIVGLHPIVEPIVDKYYTDNFKKKIDELDQESINPGAVGVRKALGFVNSKLNKKESIKSLRYITHLAAEHLSQGALSSGYFSIAIDKVNNILKKMPQSVAINQIISQLEFAHRFMKIIETNNSFFDPERELKELIANLNIGESILIPSGNQRHSTIMSIICTEIIGKRKIFALNHYNEGNGSSYHYQKKCEDGKLSFQAVLEVKDIDGEKLYGRDSFFIRDIIEDHFSYNGINFFYELILPELNGKFAPPSSDSRFWSFGQLGGSCSTACVIAFLRSKLSETSFKEFQILAKTEYLFKLYRQIKRGSSNTSMRKLVALEIIDQLAKDRSVSNELLPVLDKIKAKIDPKSLEKLTSKKKSQRVIPLSDEFDSEHINSNLKVIYKILKKSNFNSQGIEKMKPFLKRALMIKFENITLEDFKDFINIACKISTLCKKLPLNYEQIYLATVISCIFLNVIYDRARLPKDILEQPLYINQGDQIWEFSNDMLIRCFVLSLDKGFDPFFNSCIASWNTCLTADIPSNQMSEKMLRMIDNSDNGQSANPRWSW